MSAAENYSNICKVSLWVQMTLTDRNSEFNTKLILKMLLAQDEIFKCTNTHMI